VLDFGDGYSGADNFAGGSLGEGEDRALQHGAAKFFVELAQGVVVVLADAFGPNQTACGCCDFSAESLDVAGLAGISGALVGRPLFALTSGRLSIKLASES
jgi:hypothetical protein